MSKIQLRISDLRKKKQIKQTELAGVLGVSVQTVSKWENDISMPDISLLPEIAAFFKVTVDELLGLKPLSDEEYIPVRSGERGYWDSKLDYLKACRKSFWNEDYLQFLINNVWKIQTPVQVLDCGCGFGYMGVLLMPLLPEGSSYVGIDFSRTMIDEGERLFSSLGYDGTFICDDFRTYQFKRQYDLVISQCAMRHTSEPRAFLKRMIELTGKGGIVVAADINREFEQDGLYIEGLDYKELCSRDGLRKMWRKELECHDRDYAIGMRLPVIMQEEGLLSVDVRMNDRVSFVSPDKKDYEESLSGFLIENKWNNVLTSEEEEEVIQRLLNHGMDRKEAENYCRKQRKIQSFTEKNRENLTYLQCRGLIISYGWKK